MADPIVARDHSTFGPLPLVIGVTGHRHFLEEPAGLKSKVRKLLREIRQCYPHTPLILLSPLAEGADRLVAQVALEKEFAAELVVPLPFPLEEYEKDFQGSTAQATSLADFRELLDQAKRVIELPILQGFSEDEVRKKDGEARNLQYTLVGAYVARNCQILIALWDGQSPRADEVGGTSYIVDFKLTGELKLEKRLQAILENVPEPYWLRSSILDPPETGPVYHIPVTRSKQTHSTEPLHNQAQQRSEPQLEKAMHKEAVPNRPPRFPRGMEFPKEFRKEESAGEEYYARIFEHVEDFNRDALKVAREPRLKQQRIMSKTWLLPDRPPYKHAGALSGDLQWLRDRFSVADTLALDYQRKTKRMLVWLSRFAFLAAFSYGAYAHLLEEESAPWPLTLYLLMGSVAGLFYLYARRHDFQNKFQDYRAIAEGLRVQFFWRLAGLDYSAADHYLNRQMSELDWIRNAVRACSVRAEPARLKTDLERKGRMQLIRRFWIRDQFKYFRKAAWRDRWDMIRYKHTGDGFILVSLALAVWVLVRYVFGELRHAHPHSFRALIDEILKPAPALITLAGLIIFLAASLLIGAELQSHREEVALDRELSLRGRFPRNRRAKWFGKVRVNLILGLVGGSLLASLILAAQFYGLRHKEHGLLILAMGLTAVLGGLEKFYIEKMALSEHVKQYKRMKDIFKIAKRLFDPADTPETLSTIANLGKEALAENGDWVLLHRERPMELIMKE